MSGEPISAGYGRVAGFVAAVCCAVLPCCTPIDGPRYEPLDVIVDADAEVRAEVEDVEVVIESLAPGADSWNLVASRRFTPAPGIPGKWPLRHHLDRSEPRATYHVTATARDQAGAIKIQARSIREPDFSQLRELRVRFDRECLHRSALCGRSDTCVFGACVDARLALTERASSQTTSTEPGVTASTTQSASVTEPCDKEGARSCAIDNPQQPLLCRGGAWLPDALCPDSMRCAALDPASPGSCQPISPECASRQVRELFCDSAGVMHECQENLIAHVKPCGDNEHCVEVASDVRCTCLPGFVADAQGCVEASDCTDNGGCDPLTQCEMRAGQRACSACPTGYAGTGEQGCAPLLRDLQISIGTLEPAFDPNVFEYQAQLPLLAASVDLTVDSDTGAVLAIGNQPASFGVAFRASVIDPGDATLPITLRAGSAVASDYHITFVRSAGQRSYLKGEHCQAGGWFGEWFAADGDTLVVGAPLEASASVDTLAMAGAAYVYVKEGDQWRQQAWLSSPEPRADESFGMGVAIWKDRIVVGAPGGLYSRRGVGTRNGTAYTYVRSKDTWTLESVIRSPSSGASGDAFGYRMLLRDDELIVTAPYDTLQSGAGYVFRWDGTAWLMQQRIRADTPTTFGEWGVALAADGDRLAVGATHETVDAIERAGAVYIYERTPSGWKLVQRLQAPMLRPRALFGYSLALLADTLVVGAPYNTNDPPPTHGGEVHVWQHTGSEYRLFKTLESIQGAVGDLFGNSVALDEHWLLVGAPGDPTVAAQSEVLAQGKVHLFGRSEQGFVRTSVLRADHGGEQDHFGDSVLFAHDYALINSREEDSGSCSVNGDQTDNSKSDSGAAYVLH